MKTSLIKSKHSCVICWAVCIVYSKTEGGAEGRDFCSVDNMFGLYHDAYFSGCYMCNTIYQAQRKGVNVQNALPWREVVTDGE